MLRNTNFTNLLTILQSLIDATNKYMIGDGNRVNKTKSLSTLSIFKKSTRVGYSTLGAEKSFNYL